MRPVRTRGRRLRERLTRKLTCPHCGSRLGLFPPPTACKQCGRQVYPASDRRRRW